MTWTNLADPSGSWTTSSEPSTSWSALSDPSASGNIARFVDADPIADAEGGVDFHTTFSSENPFAVTVVAPIAFRTSTREHAA